jgi:hypothetical protein
MMRKEHYIAVFQYVLHNVRNNPSAMGQATSIQALFASDGEKEIITEESLRQHIIPTQT